MRPQVGVRQNGALAHLYAAALQEGGVGPDADGQHQGVGLHGPLAGEDLLHLPIALHALQGHVGQGHHAGLCHPVFHKLAHLRVQEVGQHVGGKVDHRGLHALGGQILRHLQADEAASGHHGPLDLPRLQGLPEGDGVVRGTHDEHVLQLQTRHRGEEGGRAGGNDQLVIPVVLLLAGG